MSEDRDSRYGKYTWDESFWQWSDSGSRICKNCGREVDSWTYEVPCCGAPYLCTDSVYAYACDHCRLIGETF